MVSHHEAQLALRTKLKTLSVATTGSTSLAATSTGYSRASGSFITDGFRVGMEISATGFGAATNNEAKTLTAVTATALTCPSTTTETADTGRTITAGLPSGREWENIEYEPTVGDPWVREQYIPGPMNRLTLGATAEIDVFPQYIVHVNVPIRSGVDAARLYADALLTLFAPGTPFTLTSGDTMRVRGDIGPFEGQLLRAGPSFSVVPVTVPLRLRTTNSI